MHALEDRQTLGAADDVAGTRNWSTEGLLEDLSHSTCDASYSRGYCVACYWHARRVSFLLGPASMCSSSSIVMQQQVVLQDIGVHDALPHQGG